MEWFNYLIQVNIYLILFFAFYKLILQNETFFTWNRVFLILSGALSFLIPVLQSEWVKNLFVSKKLAYVTEVITLDVASISTSQEAVGFDAMSVILTIYLVGVFFCLFKFIWQLSQISKSFELPNQALSFFRKIRVSENLSSRESILQHEQVHALQLHSADVIIFELIGIINWFNPVVYSYKKAVKFIHEFIADEVAAADSGKSEYALLLVSNLFGIQKEQLVNNFYNQSLLKKRIMMLHKPKSRKAAILKYGLTAPLFALMVILSSATLSRQKVEKVADLSSNKIFLPVVEDTMIALQTLPSNNISEPASAPKADLKDAGLSKEFNLVDTSTIFGSASVDALPEYPGGMEQFYKWIGSNYKFPKQAIEKGVSGRLVVEFVVEKNGRLTSIKPLKGLGHGTVEEAVRLLHSSKAWKPGIKNGKTVRVTYILPIQLNQPITIDPQSVSINGTGTGNNAYFLNGEIISKEDFHKLDPKTIQSLEVTKDKSQFGDHLVPKGTDGIVLIKTK